MAKQLVKGTSFLLVTSIIVKILSAVYRVPFQNIVGNEGFYIYQQVYPIYGIGMTIALTGIPLYLSKIIAKANYEDELQETFTVVFISSLVVFGVLWFEASIIAKTMGDINLAPIIRMAASLFVFAPFLAMFRGFYQGKLDVRPTAISQLIEQGIRVVIILCAASFLMARKASLYKIGYIAMFGSVLGSFLALITLAVVSLKSPELFKYFKFKLPSKQVIVNLIKDGLLMILFISFLLLFQLVDSFLVSNRLQASGVAITVSRDLKGIYDRGQPIVQVGIIFTTVFLQVLLPLLTKYYQIKDYERFIYYKKLLFKMLLIITGGATFGILVFMPAVNTVLFGNKQGDLALQVFSLAIFWMSCLQCFQVLEQSQNSSEKLWWALLTGILVKILATYYFVYYFGILGASIGTVCGLLASNIVYLVGYKYKFTLGRHFFRQYFKIMLIYIMGLVIYQGIANFFMINRFITFCLLIVGTLINGLILLYLVLKNQLLNRSEIEILPYGDKIIRMMEGKDNAS